MALHAVDRFCRNGRSDRQVKLATLDRRAVGPAHASLAEYLQHISNDFCPYIAPATSSGVLHFSTYSTAELEDLGGGRADAGLLLLGIAHTEWVRERRFHLAQAGRTNDARLICDNLVVEDSGALEWREAKNLVDWPHYILKRMYSDVGLMFGKFWTCEEEDSIDGRPIPSPPLTFLSIRPSVKVRDPKLLKDQTDIAAIIEEANDDRRDVLREWLDVQVLSDHEIDIDLMASLDVYTLLRSAVS